MTNLNEANQPVPGCTIIRLDCHDDDRGALAVLELERVAGFAAKRLFIIHVGASQTNAARGEHATSTAQAIIVVNGSVEIETNDGIRTGAVVLDSREHALIIGPGVWRRLRNFAPETILLVAAAAPYDETVYFETPQPDLIEQYRGYDHARRV